MSDEPGAASDTEAGSHAAETADPAAGLAAALSQVELVLLGQEPHLTKVQVAERAGVPLPLAERLWNLLGFAHAGPEDVAFTEADVQALRDTVGLVELGVLSPDDQATLVRTWGRSYARLAEWQVRLLAELALKAPGDPAGHLTGLAGQVLPPVEALQSYVWRRHLASAAARTLAGAGSSTEEATGAVSVQSVCFVDIVGYTSRSKELDQAGLVAWLETFEETCAALAVDHDARVIKNIGDEVLLVADDPVDAAELVLRMTALGEDPDDPFPAVRAGMAHGEVVNRLGDVYGSTVNLAARLTSRARPGTVLVDRGAHEALAEHPGYTFRHLRRTSVKGYSRLEPWVLRRAADAATSEPDTEPAPDGVAAAEG